MSDTYHTGRTERVAQYLATEGTPRTLAQIRAGIGADKESSKSLHTMLRRLVQHGRVDFALGQRRGGSTYCANARTRYVREVKAPIARKSRAAPTPTPRTTSHRITLPTPAVPACSRIPAATASEQISADVAAFIANGGRIQRLRNGDSAFNREAQGRGMKAHNEAAWKTRQEAITAG